MSAKVRTPSSLARLARFTTGSKAPIADFLQRFLKRLIPEQVRERALGFDVNSGRRGRSIRGAAHQFFTIK